MLVDCLQYVNKKESATVRSNCCKAFAKQSENEEFFLVYRNKR